MKGSPVQTQSLGQARCNYFGPYLSTRLDPVNLRKKTLIFVSQGRVSVTTRVYENVILLSPSLRCDTVLGRSLQDVVPVILSPSPLFSGSSGPSPSHSLLSLTLTGAPLVSNGTSSRRRGSGTVDLCGDTGRLF